MVLNANVSLGDSISTVVRASGTWIVVLGLLCSLFSMFTSVPYALSSCWHVNAKADSSKWINKCQFNLFMSARSEFMSTRIVLLLITYYTILLEADSSRPIFAPTISTCAFFRI